MKKNSLYRYNRLAEAFLFISILACILIAVTGHIMESLFLPGIAGIISLTLIFISAIIDSKSEDQHKPDNILESLIEQSKSNPEKFENDYRRLLRLGTRYIILLFISIILSIYGFIVIGVYSESNMGFLGPFIAGLIAVLYIILKSVLIKYEPINGYTISAENAPEIFRAIEETRIKTNTPRLDKVLIIEGTNCFVSANPIGLGIKKEKVLAIGLYPLMLLTIEEIKSICVHEFAHINRKDFQTGNLINRNINRWNKILYNLQYRGGIANLLLKRFAQNYIELMQLYYIAGSKYKEISADKDAAKFSGKETYAKASLKVAFLDYYVSLPNDKDDLDFRSFDLPPENAHDLLIDSFFKHFELKKEAWKSQILKRVSNKYDTHPSLKERIAEIGIENFDFEIFYSRLNHPEIRKIVDDFNAEWFKNSSETWEEYTAEYRKSLEIVSNFEPTEDREKNMEYGFSLEVLGKSDEALSVYNKILEKDEYYAPALYRTGIIYLNRNDEKGIELIKAAIESDNDFINIGLSTLSEFFDRNGLVEKKEELNEWAMNQLDIYKKKIDELEHLYQTDILAEADISNEKRQKIKEGLEKFPGIKKVYIATKKLEYSKEDLLIVGIISRQKPLKLITRGNRLDNADEIWEFLSTLEIPFFLLDLNVHYTFVKKLSKINNSELI